MKNKRTIREREVGGNKMGGNEVVEGKRERGKKGF